MEDELEIEFKKKKEGMAFRMRKKSSPVRVREKGVRA